MPPAIAPAAKPPIDLSAIRCLSVHSPWAGLLVAGLKPVECRSWATDYRGPLVIHAASSRASLRYENWEYLSMLASDPDWGLGEAARVDLAGWMAVNWPGPKPGDWRGDPLGGILGVVDVVDCRRAGPREPWWPEDGYAWRVANPRRLPAPIPCSGKLSLWKPLPEALAEIAKIL